MVTIVRILFVVRIRRPEALDWLNDGLSRQRVIHGYYAFVAKDYALLDGLILLNHRKHILLHHNEIFLPFVLYSRAAEFGEKHLVPNLYLNRKLRRADANRHNFADKRLFFRGGGKIDFTHLLFGLHLFNDDTRANGFKSGHVT